MAITTTKLILDIDRVTGDYISGWPRCEQSIKTILTTRLGTRIMREWWGSDFIDMMDKPQIQEVFAKGIISAYRYINLYEPEYFTKSIGLSPSADGTCTCIVDGKYLPDQSPQRVTLLLYPTG